MNLEGGGKKKSRVVSSRVKYRKPGERAGGGNKKEEGRGIGKERRRRRRRRRTGEWEYDGRNEKLTRARKSAIKVRSAVCCYFVFPLNPLSI